MAHTHDQINSIINSAMKIHRERGNVELSSDAKDEIHKWWQKNSDVIDEKISAGWSETEFATKLSDAFDRAQRGVPGSRGAIAGNQMKAALWPFPGDNDGRD